MGGPMRMNPPRGMGGMGPQVGAAFTRYHCSGSCGRLALELSANERAPSARSVWPSSWVHKVHTCRSSSHLTLKFFLFFFFLITAHVFAFKCRPLYVFCCFFFQSCSPTQPTETDDGTLLAVGKFRKNVVVVVFFTFIAVIWSDVRRCNAFDA